MRRKIFSRHSGLAILEVALALPLLVTLFLGGTAVFEIIRLKQILAEVTTKSRNLNLLYQGDGDRLANTLYNDLSQTAEEVHTSQYGMRITRFRVSFDPQSTQAIKISRESDTHRGDISGLNSNSIEAEIMTFFNGMMESVEVGEKDATFEKISGFHNLIAVQGSIQFVEGPLRFFYSLVGETPVLTQVFVFSE